MHLLHENKKNSSISVLQKLHIHCITVEYIKVVPALLIRLSAISIYAYEGGETATRGV